MDAGDPPPPTPGPWRIAGAILALPVAATVLVPGLILIAGEDPVSWDLGGPVTAVPIVLGGALVASGLALFAVTVQLFASIGRGTLAPWDPPARLVVRGPYRYLRHPMISGVALVLAGEALALGSPGIAVWLAVFVAVNAVYLPAIEEPALVRRFGPDYERFMENVNRWVPRLRPWFPGECEPDSAATGEPSRSPAEPRT